MDSAPGPPFAGSEVAVAAPARSFAACVHEIHDDPYQSYAWFRAHDPVHRQPGPSPTSPDHWYLFRHADATAALTDGLLGKRARPDAATVDSAPAVPPSACLGPYAEMCSRWILLQDAPEHVRLRSPLVRAFSPRIVHELRPRVEAILNGLLDRAARAGSMDLIAEYAFPLPVDVIAELIGLRCEDRPLFREWSTTIAEAIDHHRTPAALARADRAVVDIRRYFRGVIDERRREPGDDLLSALALPGDADDSLSEAEVVATCMMLVFAGHETTTNLIGNGTLALLRNPDQLALVRELSERPDAHERMACAIEELLRYDAPVHLTTRIVHEDHVLTGTQLRRGQRVHVLIGSANRDAEVFRDPDRLDVTRAANPHLAFGLGRHFCLGASLARLEGEIALGTLLRRFPDLRLATERVEWRRSVIFRGLARLPVEL